MAHPFSPTRHEVAPMLATVWGALAPTVGALITLHPDLGRRLALSPAWAVHATAAYIEAMLTNGDPLDEIAGSIAARGPRDLLIRAIPEAHGRLGSALKRVGDQARDLAFYRRLNKLLHGEADDLILEAAEITDELLKVAGLIAADPVLRAAHRAIDGVEGHARSLLTVLSYLRCLGLAQEIEALPAGSGWKAIMRRCKTDLARASAPAPPFAIPAGWHFVSTLAQLFDVGASMKNCVSAPGHGGDHHMIDLMTGRSVYLASAEGPQILATVRNIGPKVWTIGDMSTRSAREALRIARASLVAGLADGLASVGHTFFEDCPLGVLSSFAWHRDKPHADRDMDEPVAVAERAAE